MERVDIDDAESADATGLQAVAQDWRDMLAAVVRADFGKCDTARSQADLALVAEQFGRVVAEMEEQPGKLGAYVVLGVRLTDSGTVGGSVQVGGSPDVLRVMREYLPAAIGAGLEQSGHCVCPKCLVATLLRAREVLAPQEVSGAQRH